MKKVLCFLLSAVLCTSLMGCGKGTDNSKKKVEKENAATQLDSGDVKLTVWTGAEDEALMKKIADNFIKENADKANITIEWAPMEEGECRSSLLSDVLNGPDVYTTTDGDIRIIAAGGAASPVVNQKQVKDTNILEAVEAMTVNDTTYAYPLTGDNGYFLYYNKSFFSDSDVKSLDTMLEKAAAGNKKVAMDWSSGWYMYSFFGQTGLTLKLNEDGVTNYCDWNAKDKKIKGADVIQAMRRICTHPGFSSMGNGDWIAGIKNGKVVACVSGIWDEKAIKAVWGNNLGAAKLPEYKCGGTNVQMASFFGYKLVGVNPYSKHLGWAHKFAEYVSNEENQKLRFEMRGQVPTNNEVRKSSEIQQSVAAQAVFAQSKYSMLQRIGANYWGAMTQFGSNMVAGNPEGLSNQELADKLVKQITSSIVQ